VKRYFAENEISSLSWVEINEVAWKLTDGVMPREPVSGSLGSVSSPRALVWLLRDFMAEGYSTWFARIRDGRGNWTYGPVTVGAAKDAAEHMLRFGVFPEKTVAQVPRRMKVHWMSGEWH
jgi:hypothetical protein